MKQILILSILLFAVVVLAQAQDKNPYAQFGYEGKVLKIPQGNYGTLRITAPKKDADYQPFGLTKAQGAATNGGYRYGFNGMEKDDEMRGVGNSYDFGARLYDSRLGRWGSVDPERQFAASQYHAFGNNPVLLIDIDGGWVPALAENGRFRLIAEKGDVIEDLYSFFGGKENAKKYLPTVWTNEKIACNFSITTGQEIRLSENNVYSEGVSWYYNVFEYSSERGDVWKNTTCHGVGLLGSRQQSLIELGGENNYLTNITPGSRDKVLRQQYNKISEEDGTFDFKKKGIVGETLLVIRGEDPYGHGAAGHTAVYFGSDKDGNDYFLNKNSGDDYSIDTYEETMRKWNGTGNSEVKVYEIKSKYRDKPLKSNDVRTN